jgi:hypothetical protein
MKKVYVVIIVAAVAIALTVSGIVLFRPFQKLKCGYTEIEGFLELRAYPKIYENVPTVIVYVLVPMYNHHEIYLTENGTPLSSLQDFSENDLVLIEGVLYSRNAVDGSETYWMIEIFKISIGD